MRHTRSFLVAAMLAAAAGISACDKLKAVYCTTVLPSMAQVCQAPVDAVISLERGK